MFFKSKNLKKIYVNQGLSSLISKIVPEKRKKSWFVICLVIKRIFKYSLDFIPFDDA